MVPARRLALLFLLTSGAVGCQEPFHGSDVEMTFKQVVEVENVPQKLTPAATHFELWATLNDITVPVFAFKVVPVVQKSDPCAIDYIGPQAGMGIKEAAEARRDANDRNSADKKVQEAFFAAEYQLGRMDRLENRLKGVVSYQPGDPRPDPSIATMAPADRLAACRQFKESNPLYYVGNYRVMTDPSLGRFYGLVDANDPDSGGFVGGITFLMPFQLANTIELFITVENDDNPDTMGPVYLSGQTERRNRGILSVRLAATVSQGPSTPAGSAAIYYDQDEDSVNF